MTFKATIAAALMLSPALALAQPPEQLGNGMGTEADAAAHSGTTPQPGTHAMHRSTRHHAMSARHGQAGSSASMSGNTHNSTSNSNSGPLNPMPH
jgi:hypothetical protein